MSGNGHLRASDADRDQVVERLRRAATEGRIAADELEHRVTRALRARTYGELETTVSDLPTARRSGGARRHRGPGGWALATLRANPILILLLIPVLAMTAAVMLAATVMWAVLMAVVMLVGGRRGGPPPWVVARRRSRGLGPYSRRWV